jgi:hypothetical protein
MPAPLFLENKKDPPVLAVARKRLRQSRRPGNSQAIRYAQIDSRDVALPK